MSNYADPLDANDLSVVVSDLLVATAEHADPAVDGSVQQALRALRQMLKVNAVFVAEVREQQKITRSLDRDDQFNLAVGDTVPLEDTYCKLVLEGRLPEYIPDVQGLAERLPAGTLPANVVPAGIRAHVSTPITLGDGRVYGTLCCISSGTLDADEAKALQQLRQCAQFVAKSLGAAPPPASAAR